MNSIILKAGDWEATIVPEFGMNMIALSFKGRPILRTPENKEALESSPRLHGIPLLMPANRTADGKFSFRGKEYTLPITEIPRNNNNHGMMATAPFEIVSQTENQVVGIFRNRGERYPFSFDMTITDTLTETGMKRTLTLEALEDMPYTLAFHTTFLEPKSFYVPRTKLYIRNERLLPTGETVDAPPLPETFDDFFLAAPVPEYAKEFGRVAELDDILFMISENFEHWVLFNSDGKKGYLCIEPQCGLVNGLNIEGGHKVLKAGDKESFVLRIQKK